MRVLAVSVLHDLEVGDGAKVVDTQHVPGPLAACL